MRTQHPMYDPRTTRPKSKAPAAALDLFGRPAITKRQRIERKPVVYRSDDERAYLEGGDFALQCPDQVGSFAAGQRDVLLAEHEGVRITAFVTEAGMMWACAEAVAPETSRAGAGLRRAA